MSVNMAADIYRYGKSRYMGGICKYIYRKCGYSSSKSAGTYSGFVNPFEKFILKIPDMGKVGM